MTILIENFAISGYRSFGSDMQYFDEFKKINIFIGKNNSGKSNILRFINEIFSKDHDPHAEYEIYKDDKTTKQQNIKQKMIRNYYLA